VIDVPVLSQGVLSQGVLSQGDADPVFPAPRPPTTVPVPSAAADGPGHPGPAVCHTRGKRRIYTGGEVAG